MDPTAIVAAGYDAIADAYLAERLERFTASEHAFLDRVVAAVPEGAWVLDLGCGPGLPCTAALAARSAVVGVDISAAQLAHAASHVRDARFVRADMTSLALRPRSLDAVVAFASFGHVPRERHAGLLGAIASWLRPGGLFASQHPTGENLGELDDDWLGAPMYFSHPDLETTLALLTDAGFSTEVVEEVRGVESDGGDAVWAGIIARIPAP